MPSARVHGYNCSRGCRLFSIFKWALGTWVLLVLPRGCTYLPDKNITFRKRYCQIDQGDKSTLPRRHGPRFNPMEICDGGQPVPPTSLLCRSSAKRNDKLAIIYETEICVTSLHILHPLFWAWRWIYVFNYLPVSVLNIPLRVTSLRVLFVVLCFCCIHVYTCVGTRVEAPFVYWSIFVCAGYIRDVVLFW